MLVAVATLGFVSCDKDEDSKDYLTGNWDISKVEKETTGEETISLNADDYIDNYKME